MPDYAEMFLDDRDGTGWPRDADGEIPLADKEWLMREVKALLFRVGPLSLRELYDQLKDRPDYPRSLRAAVYDWIFAVYERAARAVAYRTYSLERRELLLPDYSRPTKPYFVAVYQDPRDDYPDRAEYAKAGAARNFARATLRKAGKGFALLKGPEGFFEMLTYEMLAAEEKAPAAGAGKEGA